MNSKMYNSKEYFKFIKPTFVRPAQRHLNVIDFTSLSTYQLIDFY